MRYSEEISKRGTGVLETPGREYASEYEAPKRRRSTPNRKLRHDFGEDFSDDFADSLADGDDDVPRVRRRPGVRLKLRGGLPRTKWGRIAFGAACVVLAGVAVRSALLHDPRFVIPSASSIEFVGNVHATRGELLDVFGEDVERNIFYVPLETRREELERMPWVAHATVMRLLPNRLRISIVERTPAAFVREGSRIGLVDANGVLLDMPPGGKGDAHYSFPVVTGISAADPLSTRAARMKLFERFTADLDSGGGKVSEGLSEVDLSNPEDVRALIPTDSTDVLVHFGEDHFLERYRKFEDHLPGWRAEYPKLASVDMRYETQAVLEMQQDPDSAEGGNGSAGASGSGGVKSAEADATAAVPTAVHAPASVGEVHSTGHPAAKVAGGHASATKHASSEHAVPAKHAASAKSKGLRGARVKPVSEVAFSVPAKKSAVHTTKGHAGAVKSSNKTSAGKGSSAKGHAVKDHSSQAVHP